MKVGPTIASLVRSAVASFPYGFEFDTGHIRDWIWANRRLLVKPNNCSCNLKHMVKRGEITLIQAGRGRVRAIYKKG